MNDKKTIQVRLKDGKQIWVIPIVADIMQLTEGQTISKRQDYDITMWTLSYADMDYETAKKWFMNGSE